MYEYYLLFHTIAGSQDSSEMEYQMQDMNSPNCKKPFFLIYFKGQNGDNRCILQAFKIACLSSHRILVATLSEFGSEFHACWYSHTLPMDQNE